MIDIKKAKEVFDEYVSNYKCEDNRIELKRIHTFHVAENSRKIAEELNLSKEEIDLAELIGLLHDIGRFEQLKIYGTFADKNSIDHADKGVEILFLDNLIRNFVEEDKYDRIIKKAVQNHNKLKIEENLLDDELLFTKIIRDADCMDIFRVFIEEPIEDGVIHGSKDISNEILSPEFIEKFKKEELLLYSDTKTDMDFMVVIFAHIYGFYFNSSLKILKDNDYIYRIVNRINAQDKFTKQGMNEIADIAMNYINKKLGEEI